MTNIILSTLASGVSETDALLFASLEDALSARGYPGSRIVALSESETLDEACSAYGTVEIRISRNSDQSTGAVVVASEWWYSEGKTAVETSGEAESFAQDCQPIRR